MQRFNSACSSEVPQKMGLALEKANLPGLPLSLSTREKQGAFFGALQKTHFAPKAIPKKVHTLVPLDSRFSFSDFKSSDDN